jgi:hypothetical protein
MLYFVCHFWENGDDFWISPCKEPEDVENYIKAMELGPNDYYIIKGHMLKGIDNTSFDIKNFKENEDAKTDGDDG